MIFFSVFVSKIKILWGTEQWTKTSRNTFLQVAQSCEPWGQGASGCRSRRLLRGSEAGPGLAPGAGSQGRGMASGR